jgi:hypothetical protein
MRQGAGATVRVGLMLIAAKVASGCGMGEDQFVAAVSALISSLVKFWGCDCHEIA